MRKEDGGYYAIKGFEYQIDKTLLEIMKSNDCSKLINIEQIQDIDSEGWVMQVKFKETAKFVPSLVKSPILKMIDEYICNNNKKYYLYCYFKELNGYNDYFEKIDIEMLKKILSEKFDQYSEGSLLDFLRKFKLINAPNFQKQFSKVIELLQNSQLCNTYDEAVFIYSNMINYIRKKIVNNSKDNLELRTCSKAELYKYIKDKRRMIFDSEYLDYLGLEEYYKKVSKDFIKPNNRRKNLICFGKVENDVRTTLEKTVLDIVENHYNNATYDIQPLIMVFNNDVVLDVKKFLINKEVIFNDGYENILFNKQIFFKPPLINKKIVGKRASDSLGDISYKVKIISKSNFDKIYKDLDTLMCYYFDFENKSSRSSFISINGLNTKLIRELFI